MSTRSISRFEFLATLFRPIASVYRKIFTPRVKQALIALAALAACIGLAVLCWQLRHILAAAVSVVLVYFGLLIAWELFPFSAQARARWAQEREWSERYWSYRWRSALWFGLGWGAWRLWKAPVHHPLDPELLFPAIYVVIGAIAYGVWHRRRQTLR